MSAKNIEYLIGTKLENKIVSGPSQIATYSFPLETVTREITLLLIRDSFETQVTELHFTTS